MSKFGIVKELFDFLKHNKKSWLLPIIVIFAALSALIVFSQGSVIAPFIYTLF